MDSNPLRLDDPRAREAVMEARRARDKVLFEAAALNARLLGIERKADFYDRRRAEAGKTEHDGEK